MMNMPPPPPGFGNNRRPKEEIEQPLTYNERISKIFEETLTTRHRQDKVILAYILKFVDCRHNGETCKAVGITSAEGRNLQKYEDIGNCIAKIAELTVEKYGFAADELVQRAYEIADFDPACIYNDDGTFKHLKDLPAEARRSVRKFECKNIMEKDPNGMETGRMIGQVMSYEFYDRMDTVKLLGREKEIFKEKKVVQHDVTGKMNEMLLAGLQRANEQRQIAMRDVGGGDGDESM